MTTQTIRDWTDYPISVQSFSLEEFGIHEVIRQAGRLGLSRVEFFHGHISPSSSLQEISALKRQLHKAEMAISAYGLYSFSPDSPRNRRVFDFATLLGIKNVIAEMDQGSFESVAALVEEYGIRVCIHTSGPGSAYETVEQLASVLEGCHPLIGVCVDTGHILRADQDPSHWIRGLGARVFALHLTDVAHKLPETFSEPLGSGHLDLDAVLAALNEISFPRDGSISIGYRAHQCARLQTPQCAPPNALAALLESMTRLAVA